MISFFALFEAKTGDSTSQAEILIFVLSMCIERHRKSIQSIGWYIRSIESMVEHMKSLKSVEWYMKSIESNKGYMKSIEIISVRIYTERGYIGMLTWTWSVSYSNISTISNL